MKKTLLVLICIISCIQMTSYSQAVVSAAKNNFVYAGIENPISIAVFDISADNISVSTDNGKIRKVDNALYVLIPNTNARSLKIKVFSLKKNDTIIHGTSVFRILHVPHPEISIGGFNITNEITIQRNHLRVNNILHFSYPADFPFNLPGPMVVKFNLMYKLNGEMVIHEIDGNKIPQNIITQLMELEESTKIIISDIFANTIDHGKSNMGSYSFILQ